MLLVVPARARRPIAITGGSAAVVMALATMSAGWHRAGDSITAFLLVGAWAGISGIVTALADDTAPARVPAPRIADRTGGRWLIATTLGSAGVGLCLAFGLVLIGPLQTSTLGAVSAFLAGGILILAAAGAVLMAVLLVLERTDH